MDKNDGTPQQNSCTVPLLNPFYQQKENPKNPDSSSKMASF